MNIQRKTFAFQVKNVEDTGAFSGYLAVFGNVDSYGDRIQPGAFAKSLASIASAGRKVPVLWQHEWHSPIGVFDSLAEDGKGLYVTGTLLKSDVDRAREAYALIKTGVISGLSIGYSTVKSAAAEGGVEDLLELELWEGSLVTFPANDAARVDAVKHALGQGHLPTLPEFERFLREAGFSKTQATAIAGGGLAKLLRSESASTTQAASVKAALDIVRSIRIA